MGALFNEVSAAAFIDKKIRPILTKLPFYGLGGRDLPRNWRLQRIYGKEAQKGLQIGNGLGNPLNGPEKFQPGF